MAGAVGGGGLGELAIQYGYQRFDVLVMLETVVVLVILVQVIQWLGDILARHRSVKWIAHASIILWVVIILSTFWHHHSSAQIIRVGIVGGPQAQVMTVAEKIAPKYGVQLQVISFDDYILPNTALNDGDIDANIFQHIPYLDSQIKAHGYKLSVIGKTFVYPMGIYSRRISSLSQLKPGAIIAIPNDPSNEGRALLLLQKSKLITLKPNVGLFGTPDDIISNPKQLQIKTLDAAQLPRVVPDVDVVVLNNDYVQPAGFKPNDALMLEGADSPYANIIVVRTQDKDNPELQKLVAIMHAKAVVQEVYTLFPDGAAIPAWPNAPQPNLKH
jgi:D-methionine transport system substrate-binding protein